MKYYVNEDCIGCGLCAGTCPEVFSMSDDGVAVAIEAEVPEEALESAAEAMDNCPVGAIEERAGDNADGNDCTKVESCEKKRIISNCKNCWSAL